MEESPRVFSCVRKPLEALPCPPPSSSPQQQFLRDVLVCMLVKEVCVQLCVWRAPWLWKLLISALSSSSLCKQASNECSQGSTHQREREYALIMSVLGFHLMQERERQAPIKNAPQGGFLFAMCCLPMHERAYLQLQSELNSLMWPMCPSFCLLSAMCAR